MLSRSNPVIGREELFVDLRVFGSDGIATLSLALKSGEQDWHISPYM